MGVPRKNFIVSTILDILNLDVPLMPLETPYEFMARKRRISRRQFSKTISALRIRGIVEIVEKKGKKFIQLTNKGHLKVLLSKAKAPTQGTWDGKWRILIFDIPETSHLARDSFRRLLRQNGFKQLQGSVFISPFPLARAAILYLQKTGLMDYIRIMKVEEMDNDQDLRKRFQLD